MSGENGDQIGPVLELAGVSVSPKKRHKQARAILRDVTFAVARGESVAIVGESGSGKTTLLRAITSLFPPRSSYFVKGRIQLDGVDVLSSVPEDLQRLRHGPVRYVFQDPALTFNPVSRIRSQVRTLIGNDDFDE